MGISTIPERRGAPAGLRRDILDVNVGLPEINEAEMMEKVVSELQGILDLPLQIDTTNLQAMEAALRIYNGKPMINSVNGNRRLCGKCSRWPGNTAALSLH